VVLAVFDTVVVLVTVGLVRVVYAIGVVGGSGSPTAFRKGQPGPKPVFWTYMVQSGGATDTSKYPAHLEVVGPLGCSHFSLSSLMLSPRLFASLGIRDDNGIGRAYAAEIDVSDPAELQKCEGRLSVAFVDRPLDDLERTWHQGSKPISGRAPKLLPTTCKFRAKGRISGSPPPYGAAINAEIRAYL
jgi:hypothetical protein